MKKALYLATYIFSIFFSTQTFAQTYSDVSPTNAEDDRCYAQAIAPNQFVMKETQTLIREGYTRVINHEAVYDTITMGVLAHAETKEILIGIYNFEVVSGTLNVSSDVALTNVDAEFDIRDQIKEAIITKWNFSNIGMCDSPANDCDLIDWVEIPMTYVPTVREQGKSIEKTNKLATSTAQLMIKVAGHDEAIPVEYRFYTKEIVAKAPKQEVVEFAPKYKKVTERLQVNESIEKEWVPIICPSKIDGFLIGQIQLALKGRNFYYGRITGIWTDMMQVSLENYQIQNDLPIGKLDKYTIQNLGLNYEMIVNTKETINNLTSNF